MNKQHDPFEAIRKAYQAGAFDTLVGKKPDVDAYINKLKKEPLRAYFGGLRDY